MMHRQTASTLKSRVGDVVLSQSCDSALGMLEMYADENVGISSSCKLSAFQHRLPDEANNSSAVLFFHFNCMEPDFF